MGHFCAEHPGPLSSWVCMGIWQNVLERQHLGHRDKVHKAGQWLLPPPPPPTVQLKVGEGPSSAGAVMTNTFQPLTLNGTTGFRSHYLKKGMLTKI